MTDNNNSASYVANTSKIIGKVDIGSETVIDDFCLIGKPHRSQLPLVTTRIGSSCYIGAYSIVSVGAVIGDNCTLAEYSSIGLNSILGDFVKVQYRAQIFKRVQIGNNCRIGGFCCNDSIIGENCSIYGSIVHKYLNHGGDSKEKAPVIGNNVIIAFNAVVIGDIKISDKCYIAPGAIVTKNVPPKTRVTNINNFSSMV